MIRIEFSEVSGEITGFVCKGHSGLVESGDDILCAFVSSACFMTANTITDVIKLETDAASTDGYMRLQIKGSPTPAQDILRGLLFHMNELQKEYPDNIKVTISEV